MVEVDDGMHGAVDTPYHVASSDDSVQVGTVLLSAVCLDGLHLRLVASIEGEAVAAGS